MEQSKLISVDDYFKMQPERTKKALIKLKQYIFKVASDTTELLNYNTTAYVLVKNGKRDQQIMIAGYKKHVGFYPHPTTMEKFDLKLSNFIKGKDSIQFPLNRPLPIDLIERIVRYRKELLNN